MAPSSKTSLNQQSYRQALQIQRPKANLLPVYKLLTHRRIRYTPAFAVFLVCAVFLSVTVSFIVTAIIARNVEILSAKVYEAYLPFDGFMAFSNQADFDLFMEKNKFLSRRAAIDEVQCAEVETNLGPLFLIGTGLHLPEDTIELLFPFDQEKAPATLDSKDSNLVAWEPGNPGARLQWLNVIVPETGTKAPYALYGWASVNPSVLETLPGRLPGILITATKTYSSSPLRDRLFRELENSGYGARIVTPFSGKVSLERATKGAFSYWQFISLIVLLAAATAIACVLTVSFLGRKRSLGILRVLGSTVSDLRRMLFLEAACLGTPGIIMGIFAGKYLSRFLEGGLALLWSPFAVAAITGLLTLSAGVWLPLKLIENANCDQLLNNKPVYVVSNPSCANCGLCGGI
jgi:hypothetical protein